MLGNRRFHTKIRKFQKNLEIFPLKYKSLFSLTALWSHSIESKFLVWSPKAVSEWLVSPGLISLLPEAPQHGGQRLSLNQCLHFVIRASYLCQVVLRNFHLQEESCWGGRASWTCKVELPCLLLVIFILPPSPASIWVWIPLRRHRGTRQNSPRKEQTIVENPKLARMETIAFLSCSAKTWGQHGNSKW